ALLAFNDVRVPDDAILGEVGKGFYHIMWELQGERLIGAAGCVAGAQRVFERTMQFALERKAFGREIGHFQVIRHKFADMATKIESARQLVYTTAWRFANGGDPVRATRTRWPRTSPTTPCTTTRASARTRGRGRSASTPTGPWRTSTASGTSTTPWRTASRRASSGR